MCMRLLYHQFRRRGTLTPVPRNYMLQAGPHSSYDFWAMSRMKRRTRQLAGHSLNADGMKTIFSLPLTDTSEPSGTIELNEEKKMVYNFYTSVSACAIPHDVVVNKKNCFGGTAVIVFLLKRTCLDLHVRGTG